MTNLVVEVSRYLIILLIAIYTYYNFRFFSMKDQEGRDLACSRQLVCMFMLHFLANMVIVLNTGLESLAFFYGAQVIFFLCYIYLYRFFYRNVSRLLVNNTCMLLCTSFIMLTRLNPSRAMRQFVIVAAAAVITWIIPLIIDRVWQLAKIPWILLRPGAGPAVRRMPFGKHVLWGPAFHLHRRLFLPAVGVCEDQLRVFCGHHVLPFHGL